MSEHDSTQPHPPRKRRQHILVPLLTILCILACGSSVYLYYKYAKSSTNQQASNQTKLLAQLGSTIQLPAAKPTIVTVADRNKLTNRALAQRVKNQDMLFVYAEAKRIIIYRPSVKKVVDMLTLSSETNTQTSATPIPTPSSSTTPTTKP